MRALGDPRAIPALQEAIARKGKRAKAKSPNACLAEDALSAIAFLEGLATSGTE